MKYFVLIVACCLSALSQSQPEQASIEGTVVNAVTGEPARKAAVMAMPRDAKRLPEAATTDANGHYRIDGLDSGTYNVIASRIGFIDQSYGTLTLLGGERRRDINIRIAPQGVITGRVVDEDGDPILAAITLLRLKVVRGRKQYIQVHRVSTDDLGEYRLFGIEGGKYYIEASHSQGAATERRDMAAAHESYAPVYYPSSVSIDAASPLEVTPGAQLRGIDITLIKVRSVRISGRVLDALDNSLPRASVTLQPRDSQVVGGNAVYYGVRTGDSMFEFPSVLPGSYVLGSDYVEDQQHLTGRLILDVGSTNIEGVVLRVGRAPEVTGRVVLEGKSNFDSGGLAVLLDGKRSGATSGMVESDGSFHIKYVMPEAYNINVAGLKGNLYIGSVKFGDAEITDAGIDFTQGVATAPMIITLKANGGQVEGVVQDENDQPVREAFVLLAPDGAKREQDRLYKQAVCDRSGHYAISGVAPGAYKLFALLSNGEDDYDERDLAVSLDSRSESVSIDENSRENKNLKLIPANEIKH